MSLAEMNGVELLDEYLGLRIWMNEVSRMRAMGIEPQRQRLRDALGNEFDGALVYRDLTGFSVPVPTPAQDERWAAVCAELNRRLMRPRLPPFSGPYR